MSARKYDVVVWGATGFTGKWVAKHLFDHYPQEQLRWAIAGRNEAKLDDVHEFIGDSSKSIDRLMADSDDETSLAAMVASTKVIITTVGPYAYYGSKLVKACVDAGTHYVDLTGEVPWIRRMVDQHQEAAQASGARIVNCCGFDSIPSDIGNFYIQQQAKQQTGNYLKSVRATVMKMKGGASGGTIHSLFNVMKEAVEDKSIRRLMSNPYSLNPDKGYRGPDKYDQRSAIYDQDLKRWTAPFVMASINTRIVRRGVALLGFPYGEDFSYSENMATGDGMKGRMQAMGMAYGSMAFMGIAATNLGRKFLSKILPAQGEGPEVNPDKPGFYVIKFQGEAADGSKMVAQLNGDADPGYGSTSKMLAESAICLALDEDDLEAGGGFWTPASAMGDHLLQRLQDHAGLTFTVK